MSPARLLVIVGASAITGGLATGVYMFGMDGGVASTTDCVNPVATVEAPAVIDSVPALQESTLVSSALTSRYRLLGALVDSTRGNRAWIEDLNSRTSAQYQQGEELDGGYFLQMVNDGSVSVRNAAGEIEILRLQTRTDRLVEVRPESLGLADRKSLSREARRQRGAQRHNGPMARLDKDSRDRKKRRSALADLPEAEVVESESESELLFEAEPGREDKN